MYGITQHNGICYVACGNKIIKLNLSGKKLREYKVEDNYNIHISTTKDGHIVYSNSSLNTVTAITDQGDTVWQYKHIKMRVPRGLDVDSVGNIFVAARGSDNIHVLSGAGCLVRIIEDIPQPMFIKLMEERMCIGTSHRKCESVDTVEDAAKNIKENGQLDVLFGDVKNLEKKLTKAKSEQEKNVAEIENSVDEIIEETEREFKELVDHLEMLKNRHLDEVAGALKKGRGELGDCTNVLIDGIQCTNYCCRNIERAKETENDAEMVMTYYRVKERLLQLEQFKFTKKQITISERKSQVLKEVRNMESFGDIEYAESDFRITYDVHDIALSLVSEFSIDGGNPNVWTGNFLSNGNFVVANCKSNGTCFIYNKDWKSTEVIDGLSTPFKAIKAGEELLVTCYGTKSIEVYSASDLHKLRSININEYVYGITKHNGACYVACGNKIIKIDMSGKKLKEYKVEWGTINISTTQHGHLVYSNHPRNRVTAITDQGDTVWQYTHLKMIEPHGLDVGYIGNIFVAARGSDNIHVLSGAGSLIRIIEDIPQPVFIKLMEERSMCCVCSGCKIMKVYKL
ncbi:uncharacterized protein LOC130049596 [Ostrea edulis]|uniref:uncharacterized protein LOC130049596 n=1 Tax=Ostrea edulis TaxID=37623 RepID=UPI0024AEE175|nr:uncharacterized protein LOC130049596 [Ostrea edulis]